MSGGAYNYAYQHIDDLIELLKEGNNERPSSYRKSMVEISEEFRELARTIEWVDSGDSDPQMAEEAIVIFLQSMLEIYSIGTKNV